MFGCRLMDLAHTVTCLLALPVIADAEAALQVAHASSQAAGRNPWSRSQDAGGGGGGGPFATGRNDDSDDWWRAFATEVIKWSPDRRDQ